MPHTLILPAKPPQNKNVIWVLILILSQEPLSLQVSSCEVCLFYGQLEVTEAFKGDRLIQ
ncbi:MAG: hypothetical protein ICV63_11540 [Coleofasciculus sp. Co-bin14]|nr:hypothetical protein [Coleofasciculus sp. Co-bin14]